MSSEEDKPPAPPVRLTSTNRGNLILHRLKFIINAWFVIFAMKR